MGNKNTVYLTQEGLEELKKELDDLINVQRPENIQAIKEARSLGDLSENAEYDAARSEQTEVEARIAQLEKMVEKAVIIKGSSKNKVSIGSKIKIEYIDDKEVETYTIVGTNEADAFENKISNESPLVKAILGKKKGDIATVLCDNGNYDVKIVDIL